MYKFLFDWRELELKLRVQKASIDGIAVPLHPLDELQIIERPSFH